MPFLTFPAPRAILLCAGLLCVTSACSGSGGSGVFAPLGRGGDSTGTPTNPTTPTTPTTPTVPGNSATFSELSALGQDLFDQAQTLSVTPEANMPVSGTAEYDGSVSYIELADVPASPPDGVAAYIVENPQIMSDATLLANFSTGTILGSFANFVDQSTGVWQGQVNLSSGTITGNTFNANLGGSTGPAGGMAPTTGTVTGTFGGSAAEFAGAAVEIDRAAATTNSALVGVLVAKQ